MEIMRDLHFIHDREDKLQLIALARERPKASPGGKLSRIGTSEPILD